MNLYLITNIINGKQYVGQTNLSLEKRWMLHVQASRDLKKRAYMPCAIRKHGLGSFKVQPLMAKATFSRQTLDLFEQFFIKLLGTTNGDRGYNLTTGGREYWNHSPETRLRIGASHSKKSERWGHKHPEEVKAKIGAAHRGKKISEETRKLMSEAAKKRGISEQTRENMRLAFERRRLNKEALAA